MNTTTRIITEAHGRLRSSEGGCPANHIPELAPVDPEFFGIALTTPDGYGSPGPGTCVGEIAFVDGRPALHATLLRNISMMDLDRLRASGSTLADRSN